MTVSQTIISNETSANSFETIVIGGGQAGLAVGYYLSKQNIKFVILDNSLHTGDSWRKRWDSLKLFTPRKFDSLPGMSFPKGDALPTKEEVAEYLKDYARRYNLPIRHGVQVDSLSRDDYGYRITAGEVSFLAKNVIVATGPFQTPNIPAFANQLNSTIQQFHSSEYKNPQQISAQSVLVVGAGNSGAEISIDLAKAGKRVWLAGRDVGKIPPNQPIGKFLGGWPFWLFMNNILTIYTPIGRKLKAKIMGKGTGLGRATRHVIAAAGVELAPRVSEINLGQPILEDGSSPEVECVIWATGFKLDYKWIKLPIFNENGAPNQVSGVVQNSAGLYFLGTLFQRALSSSFLGGVGQDAAYIVRQIGAK